MCKLLHKNGLLFDCLTKEVTFVMLNLVECHILLVTFYSCEQDMNMV